MSYKDLFTETHKSKKTNQFITPESEHVLVRRQFLLVDLLIVPIIIANNLLLSHFRNNITSWLRRNTEMIAMTDSTKNCGKKSRVLVKAETHFAE